MKNHKAIVTSALKAYRSIAFNHRYGAMMHDYRLAQQALESIEFLQQVEQPTLQLETPHPLSPAEAQ